jgi:hypothetical protein
MSQERDDFGARLEAYLAGELNERERAEFEAEALADPELAEQFASAVGLDAFLREAMVVDGHGPTARLRPHRLWPLVVSAAAVIAVMVFWPRDGELPTAGREPVLRGGSSTLQLLAPDDDARAIDTFRWSSDPGAVRYRLELTDRDGRLRHVALTGDTLLTRDDDGFPMVVDSLAGRATWRVVPILGDGREGEPSPPGVLSLPVSR